MLIGKQNKWKVLADVPAEIGQNLVAACQIPGGFMLCTRTLEEYVFYTCHIKYVALKKTQSDLKCSKNRVFLSFHCCLVMVLYSKSLPRLDIYFV